MQPHSHSVFLLLADPLDSAETAYLTLVNPLVCWVFLLLFACFAIYLVLWLFYFNIFYLKITFVFQLASAVHSI